MIRGTSRRGTARRPDKSEQPFTYVAVHGVALHCLLASEKAGVLATREGPGAAFRASVCPCCRSVHTALVSSFSRRFLRRSRALVLGMMADTLHRANTQQNQLPADGVCVDNAGKEQGAVYRAIFRSRG